MFESNPPSYVSSYIINAFVLVGVVALANQRVPLWPPSLAHAFFVLWFGVLFR